MLLRHRHDVDLVGKHSPGRSLVSGNAQTGRWLERGKGRSATLTCSPWHSVRPSWLLSRTLGGMSSSQSDDVLYPVKLDVDETALVEAQACAVAVAERRAP